MLSWRSFALYVHDIDQNCKVHSRMPCVFDRKLNQFFAPEKPGPHVVSLTGGNDQLHATTCCSNVAAQSAGIRLNRHYFVDVTVNREQWNSLHSCKHSCGQQPLVYCASRVPMHRTDFVDKAITIEPGNTHAGRVGGITAASPMFDTGLYVSSSRCRASSLRPNAADALCSPG